MGQLAQTGTAAEEAGNEVLLVLSRAVSRLHYPQHRRNLPHIDPEVANCAGVTSKFPRPSRHTLCTHDARCSASNQASTGGREHQMDERMNLGELASDNDGDGELLARYQQCDDETALARIHSRYCKDLRTYARRTLTDDLGLGGDLQADAEEIVQETFLKFHANRKRYPPQTCVSRLLYRMVENYCMDRLRAVRARKRDRAMTRPLRESHTDPKANPANQQLRMLVDELLDTLTPKQAQAVRLVRIEGHTAESAAELLNVPPTTVRKRIKDGIDTLKRRVAANG